MRSLLFAAALLAPACLPAAEPAAEASTNPADAADPQAAAPKTPHCSVLRPVAPASEPERRDWRAANADTAAAGGWRAYAKEAARTPARPPRSCPPGAPR